MHTNNEDDKKCELFSNSLLYDKIEDGYPKEWVYDENDYPTCTSFVKWDWGNDNDGWNEPPEIIPDDPNQLCLPFEMMNIEESSIINSEVINETK